ncbi:hypothetical protein KJA13_03665 [Patescibacteria group bacterium]|nr:hypothetical protein [Patescibacteria group bacterium]
MNSKGTVIIITFLILIALLLLGSYFLIFTLTELRISKSQEAGVRTYYLAEAGINEAIWKLGNDDITADGDPAWETDFIDCDNKNPDPSGDYWTAEFTHSFGDGSSYQVTIQNSACGRGKIISTSTLSLPNGKTAQRIVKTTVFKALASPVGDSAILSGGSSENVDIKFSKLRINDGNLFSNHNLDIKGASTVEVYDNPATPDDPETPEIEDLEGQVLAVGNLNKSSASTLAAEATCTKNVCTEKCLPAGSGCPPDSLSLPLVDFDSPGPLPCYSFKCRAQAAEDSLECEVLCNGASCTTQPNKCVYSTSEFEDLLWEVGEGGTLTLNNVITYVTGNIDLRGGRHLVVKGALVADDNIKIGEKYSWTRGGQKDEGFSQITIIQPTAQSPSGLLTKRKIDFGLFSSFPADLDIEGVIYANDEVSFVSIPDTSFDVKGGIIARKLSLVSLWQWLNITLDDDIIRYGLGYRIDSEEIKPTFSPVITIDHWEESY